MLRQAEVIVRAQIEHRRRPPTPMRDALRRGDHALGLVEPLLADVAKFLRQLFFDVEPVA